MLSLYMNDMETKLSYRASKKGANAASTTASVKKVKRKKNKVKQTVKGRESKESGIHSPDFDSEAQLEGDGTLTDVTDSELSPASKMTKLPLLNPKRSVSLTSRPSDQVCHKLKTSISMSSSVQTLPLSVSVIPASESTSVDAVTTRVANMAVKRPQAKSRSKSHIGRPTLPSKSSRNRLKQGDAARQQRQQQQEPEDVRQPCAATMFNETLRWEYVVDNTEEERERVAAYKINRRKRYLAAARAKGLKWAVEQGAPSPQSEDSGVETAWASPGSFAVFRTMPSMSQTALAETLVKC